MEVADYPILKREVEEKFSGSGPVIEYKLSPEELEKYRKPEARKREITKEFLEAEISTGKSLAQIAREQGMNPGTIHYYAKKFGIETSRKQRQTGEQQQEMMPEKSAENQQAGPDNSSSSKSAAVNEPTESADQNPEQEQKQTKDDIINRPTHYLVGGIETIDFIKAKLTAEQFEGYLLGNVIKYLSRYRHKNGLEDLQKAGWYLTRLINEMGGDAKWTS